MLSAAGAGRDDLLKAALAAGGNPNARDFCGDPALLLAARGGGGGSQHLACCRRLLAAGADPAAQGSRGETAVMVAVQAGSEQLLNSLLATGVDLGARTDGGLSALQLACLHRRPAMLAAVVRHLHAQLESGVKELAGSSCYAPAASAPVEAAPQLQQRAAEQAAGRQLVLAAYAAVAAGDSRCLQALVCDPLARAAYASLFGGCTTSDAAGIMGSGGSGSGIDGSSPVGGCTPAGTADSPLRRGWRSDRAAEERLQGELGFLLDPEVVGAGNARPASFLWQTSEHGACLGDGWPTRRAWFVCSHQPLSAWL